MIIKRPINKPRPRSRVLEDEAPPTTSQPVEYDSAAMPADPSEELPRIRALLRPHPIPELYDWGILPSPDGQPS